MLKKEEKMIKCRPNLVAIGLPYRPPPPGFFLYKKVYTYIALMKMQFETYAI